MRAKRPGAIGIRGETTRYPTGMCGQDPMLPPPFFCTFCLDVAPPPPPPPFFFLNINFFSYKQHFATFYVSLYEIYTINTIKQLFLSMLGF